MPIPTPARGDRPQDLLRCICGLSYEGDIRMGVAEDGGKVDKIVAGSGRLLRDLYAPLLGRAQG